MLAINLSVSIEMLSSVSESVPFVVEREKQLPVLTNSSAGRPDRRLFGQEVIDVPRHHLDVVQERIVAVR